MSETITYEIHTSETIASFIRKVCNSAGWTYKWRLRLVYEGHELSKNTALADYDIQHGAYLVISQPDIQIPLDILNVIRDSNFKSNDDTIQVHIKVLSEAMMTISLSRYATVIDLKYYIYDYSNIPVDDQRLVYNGHDIGGDRMLSHYHVQHGSTMYMVCRVRVRYEIPSFTIIDESSVKTVNEKIDIVRQAIQEVRESYNNTSIEVNRNALRNLLDRFTEISEIQQVGFQFYTNVYINVRFYLERKIKDCDKQLKLLEKTKKC